MTSNGHASGSTDGTPAISSRSTYPHDNWRSQMATSPRSWSATRVFAATGAWAGLPISPANLPDHNPGLVPGQFRRGGRPRTTEETMRHGCQDTARADTAGWE
jgi:hypothetical protein